MSDATNPAHALPPHFYDKVSPYLHLCGMGCLQFFSRPDDPLPQEITQLTGLDLAGTRQLTAIDSNETLARQLLDAPEDFYVYLLVGGLVLHGPLAEPVLGFLEQNMAMDAEQLTVLREQLLPFGAEFTELVGNFAVQDDEAARAELDLLRLQIEGAFARLSDTLQAVEAGPPAAPSADDAAADYDEDDEPILEIRFREEQLHMLRLAITTARVLPNLSERPFAQAVTQLSSRTPAAMDALEERLTEADSQTPTQLSWHDVALLYQSTQVLAMAIVSNELDALHWQDQLTLSAGGKQSAEQLAAEVAHAQEMICLMISGFVECVQDAFADDSQLQELREEVTALADLL